MYCAARRPPDVLEIAHVCYQYLRLQCDSVRIVVSVCVRLCSSVLDNDE